MARPPGRPLAHSSTLKPAGTLSLSTGISPAGVSVILPACGASLDSAIAAGLPWCQAGGGLGLSCASAGMVNAAATAAAMNVFMFSLLWEPLLELKASPDATAHAAPR